jgi:hypothetical protein
MTTDRVAAYAFYAEQQRKLADATVNDPTCRQAHLDSAAWWEKLANQAKLNRAPSR